MTGCWAIWEARNKYAFEGRHVEVEIVIRRISDFIREMRETVEKNEATKVDISGSSGWACPGEGLLKVKVDTGMKEGIETGTRVICRDSEGKVQWNWQFREKRCLIQQKRNSWRSSLDCGRKVAGR
ncbi:hypothetical protein RND81_02G097900 [Saponaria officinalis]|uniref:Uncharacterized protein n=1 Tax=Saponaria officinalis TaxID=3572 RepID=A0AAW1MLU7_SAPOF